MSSPPGHGEVWSVSRLVLEVKTLLASGLAPVWVEGEISNFTRSAAGHRYFSLKDDTNQIRCALFRGRGQQLRFEPSDGQKVVALGRMDLYGPRSEMQLVVDQLLPAGEGALERAFRELYDKLKREGLFDESRKRALPSFPRRIGVVTSARGAALRDILQVLSRRAPHVQVIVADTLVQGPGAAPGIIRALELFQRCTDIDLIIVARGGGSLEDLWSFNDESVVRTVAASRLPVIAGVGHEIDTTLTDFAADLRAPTPSAAAELSVRSRSEWSGQVEQAITRARSLTLQMHTQGTRRLSQCTSRYGFRRPEEALRTFAQIVDGLSERLGRSVPALHKRAATTVAALAGRPVLKSPLYQLDARRTQLEGLWGALRTAWMPLLSGGRERLARSSGSLGALSPRSVIDRGYAVLLSPSGKIISSLDQTETGQDVSAVVKDGKLTSRVISKEHKTWWP